MSGEQATERNVSVIVWAENQIISNEKKWGEEKVKANFKEEKKIIKIQKVDLKELSVYSEES